MEIRAGSCFHFYFAHHGFFALIWNLKNITLALTSVTQLIGASTRKAKGCWFDSRWARAGVVGLVLAWAQMRDK